MKQHLIFQNTKFSAKSKTFKLGTTNPFIWCFWAGILNNYCHKVSSKIKFLSLAPEMPYSGILGYNFEKIELYLKSVPSNLSYCKVWCKNKKSLNLGPKILYLYIFGLEFEYCHIWNQRPQICLSTNFSAKRKILKFGINNALFGYFESRVWR